MKLLPDVNIQQFLLVVDKCEGNVSIRFAEDNFLEMKSMLSKVVFATLSEKRELLRDADVICEIEQDKEKLQEFLVEEKI